MDSGSPVSILKNPATRQVAVAEITETLRRLAGQNLRQKFAQILRWFGFLSLL